MERFEYRWIGRGELSIDRKGWREFGLELEGKS